MTTLQAMMQTRWKYLLDPRLWLVLGLLVSFGVIYLLDPIGSYIYPPCMFYRLTGLYCPGCGSVRALHQLSHGHLLRAMQFNPLMVLSIPLMVLLFCKQYSNPRFVLHPVWAWSALILLVAYWVLRNIPAFPFTLLAPH